MSGLEPVLYRDQDLVDKVAEQSILKKWATCEEAAEFIFFIAVKNKSMTGQEILIDNGEEANHEYIDWR